MDVRDFLEQVFFTVVEPVITTLLYPYYILWERLGGKGGVRILMYHQVSRSTSVLKLSNDCISPEQFEVQIRTLLQAGYRVIPLVRLLQLLNESPAELPRRCVVLTFDDGFRDQFVNAYTILRKYGLSATFFPIVGYVEKEIFYRHLALDNNPMWQTHEPLSGWLPLRWDEIEEMLRNGMGIGSHSLSHRSLGRINTAEAEEEIRRSKEILEKHLRFQTDVFAYPFGSQAYGDFSRRAQEILHDSGYLGACTTVVGSNRGGADPFALRRIPMEERDGPFRVRCKLVGAYDWVGKVKTAWQGLVSRKDRVELELLADTDFNGGGLQ